MHGNLIDPKYISKLSKNSNKIRICEWKTKLHQKNIPKELVKANSEFVVLQCVCKIHLATLSIKGKITESWLVEREGIFS